MRVYLLAVILFGVFCVGCQATRTGISGRAEYHTSNNAKDISVMITFTDGGRYGVD